MARSSREGEFVREHLWISGRVQGVWFRDSAAREARRLGVRGWIRNLPDGRVETVAEGTPEAVDAYIRWCAQGPPLARVEDLERRPEEPEDLTDFAITG